MIKIYRIENGYMVKSPVYEQSGNDPTHYVQSGERERFYEFLDEVIEFLKDMYSSYYEAEQKEQKIREAEAIILNKVREK